MSPVSSARNPAPGGSELVVDQLSVNYSKAIRAVEAVSFTLAPGEVLAVLGSNGAGKSTLLRAISRTLPLHRGSVTRGRVFLDGARIDTWPASRIVRSGVVQVPEGRKIFLSMTVEDNLRAGGTTLTRPEREAALDRAFDLFPVLRRRAGQHAGLLSGGEQQMLAIARALMSGPRVLLLDEPSLGLAPKIIGQVGDIIRQVNDRGVSVIVVEQNAAMALSVATSAIVLESGSVTRSGSVEDFLDEAELAEQYLGGGESAERLAKLRSSNGGDRGSVLSRWIA